MASAFRSRNGGDSKDIGGRVKDENREITDLISVPKNMILSL